MSEIAQLWLLEFHANDNSRDAFCFCAFFDLVLFKSNDFYVVFRSSA